MNHREYLSTREHLSTWEQEHLHIHHWYQLRTSLRTSLDNVPLVRPGTLLHDRMPAAFVFCLMDYVYLAHFHIYPRLLASACEQASDAPTPLYRYLFQFLQYCTDAALALEALGPDSLRQDTQWLYQQALTQARMRLEDALLNRLQARLTLRVHSRSTQEPSACSPRLPA